MLERIQKENDIKELNLEELEELALEIRGIPDREDQQDRRPSCVQSGRGGTYHGHASDVPSSGR